jgi:hypothetical protein
MDGEQLSAPHVLARLAGGGFFLDGADALRCTAFNALAGVELAIEGRYLDLEGQLRTFGERLVPNTDRSIASAIYTLGAGWLLNAHVRAVAGSPRVGQCFALLEIVRGRTGASSPIATLLQGYVTDTSRIAWPGSPIRPSIDGSGVLRSITGTDPAAGAEISETVPTNARWYLYTFRASLVTDATVANRQPVLVVDDGTSELFRAAHPLNQTAGTTWMNSWTVVGAGSSGGGFGVIHALPDRVILPGGSRIRTVTNAIQAGDNWSAPQLLVEEWIED